MRKGLFASAILAGGLVFSLVGCGGSSKPVDKSVYTITIDNKEEMQAEWLSDAASRSLSLTITKDGVEQNATQAINKGEITFEYDEAVVRVQGRQVSPVAEGTTTLTAKYGKASDEVNLTITYSDPHGKSADDPLTVAEAIAVCEATGETETNIDYYTHGYVFNCAGYDATYENITFDICDNLNDTSKFVRCYRVVAIDQAPYDVTKIDYGSEVLVCGHLVNYKSNTPEYPQGSKILTATEGLQPQTITATVAEALAVAKALPANNTSFDKYEITGYITNIKAGSGFYMSDTKGAVTPTNEDFLVYYGTNALPEGATLNAKVKVLAKLKHYVSSSNPDNYAYETGGSQPEAFTLLEAGDTPVEATEVNVTQALAVIAALEDNANAEGVYAVTGYVCSAEAYYKKSDGTGNLTFMMGDSADAAAEAQLKAFRVNMTEAESADFVKGAKVKLTGTLQKYVKNDAVTPEILSVTEFNVLEKVATKATVTEALAVIAALADNAYAEGTYEVTGYVVSAEAYYKKSDGTGNLTFMMGATADAAADAQLKAFRVAMTEEESAGYVAGAKVTLVGQLQKYVKNDAVTPEICNCTSWKVEDGEEPPVVEGETATFTPAEFDGKGTANTGSEMSATVKDITITISKGYGTTEIRAYAHSSLSIKCNGGKISALAFTFSGGKDGGLQAAYSDLDTEEWKVEDLTAQARFSSIVVTYTAGGETPVEIPQPKGTFFASAELSDAGIAALTQFGVLTDANQKIVPIFVTLGENNAVALSVNGKDFPVTFKSYDKTTGELKITHAQLGDLIMIYDPETTNLTKLSTGGLLKYDGGQSLRGNDKLKYWNCDGTTAELQAQFTRRYNNPWQADTSHDDRVVQDTEHAISGSAAKVRAWDGGRIALAVNDFATAFNGRNLSFWVYNPGSADISLQSFYYKQTGYNGFQQIFSGKTAVAGQWTYISVGFEAADVYAFQIVVPNGTATQLTFDDICLF